MNHVTRQTIIDTLDGNVDTFVFQRKYQVHLIPITLPHFPRGIFGNYSYRTHHNHSPQNQPFFMSCGDDLESNTRVKEISMIIRLGDALERRFKDAGYQVIDIQLPPSHGFSGNRYAFRQTKDTFPELA